MTPARYRHCLPQLEAPLFLTDGGLETTLIYHDGLELPCFAAFTLLDSPSGRTTLQRYFERYVGIARDAGVGIVLETPTWRANRDWGARVGYDAQRLADVNRRSVELLLETRAAHNETPVVISGNLGPRGDGYDPAHRMGISEARDYHGVQIATFAPTAADMIAAFTMNYGDEAIGIAQAARETSMPAAISFTVETDGRLPSGETLRSAIERTDELSDAHPAYYLINCAHPEHFSAMLASDRGPWVQRIRGLRANASRRSHAELDASTELDAGDPRELAQQYRALRTLLPNLSVVGGCCGTDHTHVAQVCHAMVA